MENTSRHVSMSMQKASDAAERTAETIGDTIVAVLDRLAGTKSDLKLSFDQLTFDTGVFKATVNGAVILEATMAKEYKPSS
jgi:hypothetical protein